jgi:hypothetical protein
VPGALLILAGLIVVSTADASGAHHEADAATGG